MLIKKAASIPLVLHDPFFSIWSSADHLYDTDPVHWSGARQKMRGYLTVDGKVYCFLGDKEFHNVLPQKSLNVTATATEYTFENEEVRLVCCFTSPLLPENMTLLSRPCTYVDFTVEKKNASVVTLDFEVYADLVRQKKEQVVGSAGEWKKERAESYSYASMGRAVQQPLNGSADAVTIDWGYVYLACNKTDALVSCDNANEKITAKFVLKDEKSETGLIIAYDDLLSINYFGEWRKGYWTKDYATILDAIGAAFADKEEVKKQAAKVDLDIETKAWEIGGEDYVFLCNMSFRQTIAAHKLITDENGEVIFLSKENASNGCIGTLDVSYPSAPLFLMYDTEYIKGMLRPILRFAAEDVWEYDFAPHDVGRYPYAWGQVYGARTEMRNKVFCIADHCVYPPFYMYPAGSDLYEYARQMPVEECGNMLIMIAEICRRDQSGDFARPYWDTLRQWNEYLLKYGRDPEDQYCTDDFAGHLAHNVNLSVKAIVGVEAYARIAEQLGYVDEAKKYHAVAKDMASDWEERAAAGDHYSLTFDNPESWSLKYNLIWDKLWGCHMFSDEVYEKELAYYEKKANRYGVPLDNRSVQTKSDWILWCAAMTEDKEQLKRVIHPVADYLENTETRVPFSDNYLTDTGRYRAFVARSVQGGIFMPIIRFLEQ